jgi:membrane protein
MAALLRRLVGWVLRTFATLLARLASVGLVYSGVVLAAQTFMALLPLLIVVVALLPTWVGASLTQNMRSKVGISGETDHAVGQLIASRPELPGLSILGILVVLASATSFTRALQRVYELSWGLPRVGMRGSFRGVAWLVGVACYVGVLGLTLHYLRGGLPATTAKVAISVAGGFALWWWTPFVLLMGRVRLRSLLPSGLVTGASMVVLGQVSLLVVPRTIHSQERQFGTIGVAFAIQSWLVVVCCTIVAAAVVGAVTAQSSGPLGALARGSADPEAWRRPPRRS